MFEVIESSAAATPCVTYTKNNYLDETEQPVSFIVALMKKDMGLALELAKKMALRCGSLK
jgi:3-hydroxyisobutyrate dehydrogenase